MYNDDFVHYNHVGNIISNELTHLNFCFIFQGTKDNTSSRKGAITSQRTYISTIMWQPWFWTTNMTPFVLDIMNLNSYSYKKKHFTLPWYLLYGTSKMWSNSLLPIIWHLNNVTKHIRPLGDLFVFSHVLRLPILKNLTHRTGLQTSMK
jgi:hypothetical protein